MARSLIIAGLIVFVLGVLVKLFALVIAFAIPIGLALLVVGAIWMALERAGARR